MNLGMLCDKNKSYNCRARGERSKRGRHRPVGILEELDNVDIKDVVFCMGAVEAVVIVKELCDEALAEAK